MTLTLNNQGRGLGFKGNGYLSVNKQVLSAEGHLETVLSHGEVAMEQIGATNKWKKPIPKFREILAYLLDSGHLKDFHSQPQQGIKLTAGLVGSHTLPIVIPHHPCEGEHRLST